MMSHRGKRQALTRLDDITPVATKRRKGRPPALAEEEDASAVELRLSFPSVASTSSDMKISSIYNRSVTEAPAELFRKDLISAMKLPDSEPLTSDHYWVITDQWKQEWERGVQVPVKPDSLPGPVVSVASGHNSRKSQSEFKLPKNKYIRITKDEHFRVDEHYLSNAGIQAEKSCAYDLEDVDVVWLNIMNGERALMGRKPVSQDQLERIIEELEMQCWEKVHAIVKKEEGIALEFDESVICDVCRSPDSEDGNEMVFCDRCNICVHQACYGITSIPEGSWVCRTCTAEVRPECVLCPNKNGAMKSTRSGQKWAHVSCALWIPEVSIGCVEKMEPITRISSIPGSRWALICVLCRERVGACIQCSVKTCKTAYHVTCAFKHGLEMRAIIDEDKSSADKDKSTVKLRSYCQKHSITSKKETVPPPVGEDEEVKKKTRRDLTLEEKNQARAVKLQEIEAEFEKHVNVKDITRKHDVDVEGLEYIYNYWVLKRRAAFNKPLIPSRSEDASNLLNKNQEQQTEEKMRMFVQLRQDLERVRNLCYMVSRREKISRMYQRLREQTFHKQANILSESKGNLSSMELLAIKEANHGPSIYDRVYSHPNAPDLSTDFETMVRRIAGYSDSDSPRHGANGFVFASSSSKENKRTRYNGEMKSPASYDSISSSASDADAKNRLRSESESEARSKLNNHQTNKFQRKNVVEANTKNRARRRPLSSAYNGSSTEAEDDTVAKCSKVKPAQRPKKNAKKQSTVSRSFELLERGITSGSGSAGDDTEDDLFIKKPKGGFKKKNNVSEIYSSDSESSDKDDTKSSRNKVIRTKASMKEFTAMGGSNRSTKGGTSATAPLNSLKRKKVNNLFNDESDKSDRLSANDSDVCVSSRKPLKGATTSSVLPKSKAKSKAGSAKLEKVKKSPKLCKELDSGVYTNDDISATSANYLDALPLVPQRAAAKKAIKAIEHIKNGMVKPASAFDELETYNKSSVKPAKCIKKDQQSSSTKHKSGDVDGVKADGSRASAFEKRTTHPKSISSGIHHPNVGSSASPVSAIATVATSSASGSNNSAISNSRASALNAPVAKPAHPSCSSKNASSSSSGSSSGSSSSGSSSSSDSSGSSSSGSSSGSSSSGSSSSSSSSESEAEDAPTKVATKKPPANEKSSTDAMKTAISNSSMTPVHKPMPECKKRELEAMKKAKEEKATTGSEQDVSGLADGKWKPEDSPRHNVDLHKLNVSPPKKEPDNENCSIGVSETNAAVEQITSGEPEFTLPPYWELEIGKNELPPDNEMGGKETPTHTACRGHSLFSPIKDIDFGSFDGELSENNNLVDNNFSLASLSSIFTNELVYKEDTKEDSVRETLNLVEKLKSEMARKQISHSDENVESMQSTSVPDLNTNVEVTDSENTQKPLPDKPGDEIAVVNVEPLPPPPTTNETRTVDQMLGAEGGMYDWRSFPSTCDTSIKESDPVADSVNNGTNMPWPPASQMMGASYTQSLTIHTTPCAATASFTTTSQNMAMITSIISPTPPLGSDDTVATPVSASSVNFEERFAEIVSKPAEAILNAADNAHIDVCQEQSLPQEREPKAEFKIENQKADDSFPNVIDSSGETLVDDQPPPTPKKDTSLTSAIDRSEIDSSILPSAEKDMLFANTINRDETISDVHPPAEQKEPEKKSVPEPSVSAKSIPVTATPSSISVAASAAVPPVPSVPSSTPPMKTPQTPSYKKSPTRPTRASARVSSQNKSPATKSPVVSTSPIRAEVAPVVKGKRESGSRKNHRANKTTTNRRGRGRGRGRNALSNCFYRDWDGDTIQDKLVGTVYDFDDEEEPVSDNFENLRALRERRKSTDTPYCDRLSTSSKDTCYSPKFASPSPQLQHSKRKGSVASTPDRRGSHRSQLSPLCEIGNNSRVMQKDLYRPEDEEDDDEEEDQAGEQEEEEEESFPAVVCKKASGNSRSDRAASHSSATSQGANQSRDQFSNMVGGLQPLLPGAVDMRTYEPAEAAASNHFNNAAIDSLNTSVAESASDTVEDFEKELHNYPFVPMSAGPSPRNSSAVASPRLTNDANKTDSSRNYFADENAEKNALLDGEHHVSRNQLRVKIKGPYSDANYAHCVTTTSSTVSAQQLASVSNSGAMLSSSEVFPVSSVSLTNTYPSISSTSSSNLRRMRKKELLEQYKAQGDESGNDVLSTSQNFALAGEAHAGMAGNSPVKSIPPYKIPKAVASMTTIPTKEDYKAVLETAAYIEKKKRGKDKSSTCLDAADISNNNSYNNHMYKQANNVVGSRSPDRSFSNFISNNVVDNHGTKRKSRSTSSSAPPPKLKIKIGPQPTVVVEPVCTDLKARPPKKRLCDQSDVVPSASTVEQYRENMRYRSRVISEFNENGHRDAGVYSVYDEFSDGSSIKSDRKKRKKRSSSTSRSSRRRKKQQRSSEEHTCEEDNEKRVQVITNTENGRIIIKFGAGKKDNKKEAAGSESTATSSLPPTAIPAKPSKSSKRNVNHELDSVRTNKITPIRLKLARSKDGYVTKPSSVERETSDSATTNAASADTLPKGSQATETTVESVSSAVESANAQAPLPVSTAS